MNSTNGSKFTYKSFPVGALGCNCTLVVETLTGQSIVIDPGGDATKILSELKAMGSTEVKYIIHTHAHFDHIMAAGEIHQATSAPIGINKNDHPLWENLKTQCEAFGMPYIAQPPPTLWLEDEHELEINNFKGVSLFTPGHTPGSMCFLFESENLLLAGDTLFKGSIGRTDLWGGDYPAIEKSIKSKLYKLDEKTTVITGHGEPTTIGFEMRHNGFIRA